MSQAIINSLNGYTLQDARVDDINISGANTAATVISRTLGQQGIEVRNNRLILSNGGYYETGAVFEDVGNEYVLDNSVKTSYSYDISGTPQNYLGWLDGGNPVQIWIMGSNGETEIEEELEGSFDRNNFVLSGSNISLTDYGINAISIDTTTMEFSIFKDTRNEDNLTLTEIAVYLPNSDPVQWPVDLVDVDSIYDAILDRLISEGYVQSQL